MSLKLGSWLVSLASPIARTVLKALGIGVVTMVGVDVALGSLLSTAKAAWGSMPAAVAAYVALAGANTGLSIIAGALVARVSLIPLKRMRLL